VTAPTLARPVGEAGEAVTGPLSYGQLSVWRDVELFPPEGRHQANICRLEKITTPLTADQIQAAFGQLRRRHEALRTTYDLSRPDRLRQVVRPPGSEPARLTEVPVPVGGDPDAVAEAAAAGLTGRPFDLSTEESWRLAAVVRGGRVTHLILVVHHIAVDKWAEDLLERDLQALLTGQPTSTPAGSPLDLARAQHSAAWRDRRHGAEEHLRRVYTTAARAATAPVATAGVATVKVNLRSWTGLAAARAKAGALRASAPSFSLPSLVLAAYCHTAHQVTGATDILVNAMTANRLHAGTATMVSSMNQWARMVSHHVPGEPFDRFALRLHDDSLTGYRHGCYDVDLDVRLRREAEASGGPIGAEIFFNYVQSTAAPDEEDTAADRPDWRVRRLPANFLGGPAFYLVASQGHRLELTARTRWSDVDGVAMEGFLTGVHDLLFPTATAGPHAPGGEPCPTPRPAR
jgi:hypothetical protein